MSPPKANFTHDVLLWGLCIFSMLALALLQGAHPILFQPLQKPPSLQPITNYVVPHVRHLHPSAMSSGRYTSVNAGSSTRQYSMPMSKKGELRQDKLWSTLVFALAGAMLGYTVTKLWQNFPHILNPRVRCCWMDGSSGSTILSCKYTEDIGLLTSPGIPLCGTQRQDDKLNSQHRFYIMVLSKGIRSVAVIGAGAAGLVAGRVLKEAGFQVTIYEALSTVGGVWLYRKDSGPMYDRLVTNLPKEVMQYSDIPFPEEWPSFVHHTQVLEYLQKYSDKHNLWPIIKLRRHVKSVHKDFDDPSGSWEVASVPAPEATAKNDSPETVNFDAVVVCNGHYNLPYVPAIPGLDSFDGEVIHSMVYRNPEVYAGRKVLIIGARASGVDLAREIAMYAVEVNVVERGVENASLGGQRSNVWRRPAIQQVQGSEVHFVDNSSCTVDCVILATGYKYSYPFLDEKLLQPYRSRGELPPLYKFVFHAQEPSLCFLGIPQPLPAPFLLFEVQANWAANVWSGKAQLPSPELQEQWRKENAALRGDSLVMTDLEWEYCRDIITEGNITIPGIMQRLQVVQEMYANSAEQRPTFPGDDDRYRRRNFHVNWDTFQWTVKEPEGG